MIKDCLLIGLGQIGMGYDFDLSGNEAIYTHARAISLHPDFRLVGAVDVSPKQRARFEQRYGFPAFEQVEAALLRVKPDLVVIATKSASHSSILARVLNVCRPRLIFCEKPLAYELSDALSMVEACEKVGIELFVNYIRRTDPGVGEVKRRIEKGEISSPIKVNVWYSKGIFNNASHFLNLLEFWLGDIEETKVISSGRLWENQDPEPDFIVKFQQGTAVFQAIWEEAFSHYSVELLSSSGRLRYDQGGEAIEWRGVYIDSNFKGYKVLSAKSEVLHNGMSIYQWHAYDQISKYLGGGDTTLCTGRQALKTLELIDKIIHQRLA